MWGCVWVCGGGGGRLERIHCRQPDPVNGRSSWLALVWGPGLWSGPAAVNHPGQAGLSRRPGTCLAALAREFGSHLGNGNFIAPTDADLYELSVVWACDGYSFPSVLISHSLIETHTHTHSYTGPQTAPPHTSPQPTTSPQTDFYY